jgi:hypothetical protein
MIDHTEGDGRCSQSVSNGTAILSYPNNIEGVADEVHTEGPFDEARLP